MARLTKAQKDQAKAARLNLLRSRLAEIKDGHCPECGTKLYRNTSLPGWYQCGHYGSEGFQQETGPQCDYQTFYDPTPEEASILAKESETK
jgi:uncharacterized Zn finger protein (UPF0148 family)